MKISSVKKGNNVISVKHVLIGVVIALVITLLSAGVYAILAGQGSVKEGSLAYLAPVTVLLASFLGCILSSPKGRDMILLQHCTTALIYFLVLVCINIVFFEGTFTGVILTVAASLLGAVLSGLIKSRGPRKKKFMKGYRK